MQVLSSKIMGTILFIEPGRERDGGQGYLELGCLEEAAGQREEVGKGGMPCQAAPPAPVVGGRGGG